MATYGKTNEQNYQNIADTLRRKSGHSSKYKPSEMAPAINSLDTAVLSQGTFVGNGVFTVPEGANYDGWNYITVQVPNTYLSTDEGKVVYNNTLVPQTAFPSAISLSGTYDTTLYDEVTVDIPDPVLLSKSITQNGIYKASDDNADGYSEVTVSTESNEIIDVDCNIFTELDPDITGTNDKSAGFVFYSDRQITVKKVRVFPTTNIVSSIHLTRVSDNVDLAVVTDLSVLEGQWNDVDLPLTVTLEANEQYLLWYSEGGASVKYAGYTGNPYIELSYMHHVSSKYHWGIDTRPTETRSGSLFGIDIYVDTVEANQDDIVAGSVEGAFNLGSITTIAPYAFYSNQRILGAKGSAVDYIGEAAFYNCFHLRSVSLPTLASIGSASADSRACFNSCSALKSVYAPGLTYIGDLAFNSCANLQQASFPFAVTIGSWAFRGCTNLKSADFPNVLTVGSRAFGLCSNLSYANFPELEIIPSNMFDHCTNLSTVSIPKATTIPNSDVGAFCLTALQSISFPLCTYVGSYAFSGCSSLSSVYLPICSRVGNYTFRACPISELTSLNFPALSYIGEHTFDNCQELTTVNLSLCSYLGYAAFVNCQNLTTVNLPLCTGMNSYTFQYCINLTSISCPELITINNGVFACASSSTSAISYWNNTLSEVYFPKCTRIYDSNFIRYAKLKMVSLPSISSIGTNFMYQCSALESLYMLGSSVATVGNNPLLFTPMSNSTYLGYFGSIYVKASLLTSWKTATRWSTFSSRFVGLTDEEIGAL